MALKDFGSCIVSWYDRKGGTMRVLGSPAAIADIVVKSIYMHRNKVPGRYTDTPRLKQHSVDNVSADKTIVRFWSEGGWFHDCYIRVEIEKLDNYYSSVTIYHCGDTGMKQLTKLVFSDL